MQDLGLLRELDRQRVACVQAASPAVVSVCSRRGEVSGIAWNEQLVVSAAERLAGFDEVRVTGSNGNAEAEVVALDVGTDVAVLRSARVWDATLTAAPTAPPVGSSLAVLGREAGEPVCSWGSVRRLGGAWHSRAGGRIAHRIELDLAAVVGDGLAIIDLTGALVGMAVLSARRRMLGIPTETIGRIVAEVAAHGRLRRGYLGLSVQLLPASRVSREAEAGPRLLVCDVIPASPAEAAGLSVGDLLLEAEGTPLAGAHALSAMVYERAPGETIRLLRSRGGVTQEIRLQLGERPAG